MENDVMLEACHHYIKERVFPILYMHSSAEGYVCGTGAIIENEGKKYLITARHVLDEKEGKEYSKILFPLLGPCEDSYSLPHDPYLSKGESNADFAIVPLVYEEKIIEKIYWKTFNMDSFFLDREIDDDQAIFVHGYPRSLQQGTSIPIINIGLLSFITKLYKSDVSRIENYNSGIDILFEYTQRMLVNGKIEEIPNLKGISGSLMFCIDHSIEGLWSPEQNLKIIGIEKAVKKDDYIRATKSSCISKSLVEWFKEI